MKKTPAVIAYLKAVGRQGGKARAAGLTKARRAEIAKQAAQARWSNHVKP